MKIRISLVVLTALSLFACADDQRTITPTIPATPVGAKPAASTPAGLPKVSDFQNLAAAFGYRLEAPVFETTPDEVDATVAAVLNRAELKLSTIIAIPKINRTFENTIRAIDDAFWEVSCLLNRLDLIKETSTSEVLRDRVTEKEIEVAQWFTGVSFREDLYNATVEFNQVFPDLQVARPDLSAEDLKFGADNARDYKRSGMTLPKDQRNKVEELNKKLDELSANFSKNISEDKTTVALTQEELEGVPADAIEQFKKKDGKFIVAARLPTQAVPVLENGKNEEARRKVITARYQVAMEKNVPIFEEALKIRDQVAHLLGYESWADYRTETRMAKSFENSQKFVKLIAKGLVPKMKAETAEMLALKRRDTANPNAEFKIWDYYYYMNQLQKEKYAVNHEEIKNYFPADRVLSGMLQVYASMFQLKFTEVEPPYKWVADLRLFMVQDKRTNEPLGLIYFDLFPRDGKYDHFAQFGITNGKRFPDGTYQRPVVAIVGNFPPPTANTPSLLQFDDVETMFHEFGHALHSVLTQANYNRYSGTSVQDDFVEAPSQMLENWVLQKEITDIVSSDWRNPSNKISQQDLERIRAAKFSTSGIYYIRQMALALSDFRFHAKGEVKDSGKIVNDTFSEIFLPLPEGTNFAASWGHLMGGYDSGYYGYAWAKAIASDMFTAFKANPKGFMDSGLGMRLRNEIYAVGGARDAIDSVRAFLGRNYSIAPFFAEFGVSVPNEN